MTRTDLIESIAYAIAQHEGFFITSVQAAVRKIRHPTLAQRNANPGNIRAWKNAKGISYPVKSGYVDFVSWASERFPNAPKDELVKRAADEGWRVLRVLMGQYIDGKYHGGSSPSLKQMFEKYAPASDHNDPLGYAERVASKLKISIDKPLREVAR